MQHTQRISGIGQGEIEGKAWIHMVSVLNHQKLIKTSEAKAATSAFKSRFNELQRMQ